MTTGERKKIFLFRKEITVVLFILFCLSMYILRGMASSGPDISTREYFWQQRITTVGPFVAYNELSLYIKNKDASFQHKEAHIFGGALFKIVGLSGISACDSNFGYGCFHQFVGTAINMLGIGSVATLNQECLKMEQIGACQHGIGHGLISYLGYDEASLSRAIIICDSIGGGSDINGCTGGLFMEYNMRTMLGENAKIRPLGEKGWSAECSKYSGISQKSCTYYLGQWWWALLSKMAEEEKFAHMGDWCSKVSDEKLKRICFEGVGQMAPAAADYKTSRSVDLCKTVSLEYDKQLYCRSYGANTFLGIGFPEKAKEMCNGLSEIAQAYCIAYATGEASLSHELSPLLLQ